MVIATHTAWALIGFEGGDWELNQLGHDFNFGEWESPALVRIKGGRALYENVDYSDGTRGDKVRLAKIVPVTVDGQAKLRVVYRYVDADTLLEVVLDD